MSYFRISVPNNSSVEPIKRKSPKAALRAAHLLLRSHNEIEILDLGGNPITLKELAKLDDGDDC